MTGHRSGFWAVAFAFLVVMAFATLPSPLYGLYRERDGLSALIEDGVITSLDVEPAPGVDVSSCDAMLGRV